MHGGAAWGSGADIHRGRAGSAQERGASVDTDQDRCVEMEMRAWSMCGWRQVGTGVAAHWGNSVDAERDRHAGRAQERGGYRTAQVWQHTGGGMTVVWMGGMDTRGRMMGLSVVGHVHRSPAQEWVIDVCMQQTQRELHRDNVGNTQAGAGWHME